MTKKQKIMLARIVAASLLLVALEFCPAEGRLLGALYLAPYLVIGYDILRKAALGVRHGEFFDESFLMALATLGAMALGEYREGAAVMLFYQIGELFQSYAVGKSRGNIAALMDIRPDYANVEDADGALVRIDPDEVEIGTVIVVRPGERVPIDGVIERGASALDTKALTGESLPRAAGVGDEALSGCINLSGVLHIRTTKEAGESTAAKILDLVENSSMKKSRSENFITRFARVYTPFVCAFAAALAVLVPLARLLLLGLSPDWAVWVERAFILLVISCPCALVISVPLSFFAGIGSASANGILVKGSNYLELLSRTALVAFDKTGTLTRGTFEVTEVFPEGITREALLCFAAAAESFSSHPISLSLKKAFGGEIRQGDVTGYEEIAGHGVTATVGGRRVAAGNARLMARLGLSYREPDAAGTVVHVAVDGRYVGCILVSDVLKPVAPAAIRMLKAAGVRRTVMLTGDAPAAAAEIARAAGVDEFRASLLPGDKVAAFEALLGEAREGEKLAFVGDGINDAPVLARADVGIAMGAMGSDAAIEAADVVLMHDDPRQIGLAMRIAKKTMGIVRQNIVLALGVKAVCLALGAMGFATMWMAIFADVGVMVLAVLNALRALRVEKEETARPAHAPEAAAA